MTRETCALCALKHLAQAWVLMLEYRKGFPSRHYRLALGHMAEAEDELVCKFAGLAAAVREARKKLEANPKSDDVDFGELVEYVEASSGYGAGGTT